MQKAILRMLGLVLLFFYSTGVGAETRKLERLFFSESERAVMDARRAGDDGRNGSSLSDPVKKLTADPRPESSSDLRPTVRFDGYYFEHGITRSVNRSSVKKHDQSLIRKKFRFKQDRCSGSDETTRSITIWINGERWVAANIGHDPGKAIRIAPCDPARTTVKIPQNVQLSWLPDKREVLVNAGKVRFFYLKPGDEIPVMFNGSE